MVTVYHSTVPRHCTQHDQMLMHWIGVDESTSTLLTFENMNITDEPVPMQPPPQPPTQQQKQPPTQQQPSSSMANLCVRLFYYSENSCWVDFKTCTHFLLRLRVLCKLTGIVSCRYTAPR